MKWLSQQPWGLAIGFVLTTQVSATPSVNVGMEAAFPAGPYLLELLETAAGENSSAYFPLLDRIASGYFSSASTDAILYAKFLDVLHQDGHVTTPEALSTFNLALSLRSAAPRIEAHYQYYDTAVKPEVGEIGATSCANWMLFDNKQYCTPDMKDIVQDGLFSKQAKDLPFDRTLGVGRDAVLYADPTSPSFGEFHVQLARAARSGALNYRLRYRRTDNFLPQSLPISGYGVELALKRTDYIVIDDRAPGQDLEQKTLSSETILDEEQDVADLKPLSTTELSSLGMKAASFILQGDEPLETLVRLTQDLPRFSGPVALHNISDKFAEEFQANQALGVPAGINFLWINGMQLIERQIQPFTLIEVLRRERKLINGLKEQGMTGEQAISLLGHKEVTNAKGNDQPLRYDWTDRPENGRVLLWLNDLENDEAYEHFPKEINSLLQMTYPGQLPPIARNIFNVIAPVDISNLEDLAYVTQLMSFVQRGIPIRFGLVPLTPTPEAAAHCKLAYYLFESYGIKAFMAYIQELQQGPKQLASEKILNKIIGDQEPLADGAGKAYSEIINGEAYSQQINAARRWAARLRADTPVRLVLVNGLAIPRDGNWMQAMSMQIGEDLQIVQNGVFQGTLQDDSWIPGLFLEKAATRRNAYIKPDDEKKLRVLDIKQLYDEHKYLFGSIPVLNALPDSTKENWALVTVLADLTKLDGQNLALAALEFKRNNPGVQLGLVHNQESAAGAGAVNKALQANVEKLTEVVSLDQLKGVVETESKTDEESKYGEALSDFLTLANILPGTQTIILNGRVIGPISSESPFDAEDFQQFLEFEQSCRILPVFSAMDNLGLGHNISNPLAAAKLTSITALSTISDMPEGIFESTPSVRSNIYDNWQSKHSAIEIGNKDSATIQLVGLLNPVSEQGQRWSSILKVLSELDGVYVKLFLNPKENIAELPVKRFFRYVLQSKPSFSEDGLVKGLGATFENLPSETLLTTAMDVPPAWLVAPQISAHDLDNIKLSSVKTEVSATYVLKHILIEGHSREGKGSAPRGVQLVLATERDPLLTDTLVMSNLGFFQFKANPGFYNIQLKKGRSADIYKIESIGAQGWNPVPGDNGTELALMDFQGATLYPRLQRLRGMENEDVLEEDTGGDNIVSKGLKFAEGLFGGGSRAKLPSAKEHADINIFSVASGHLYERMLNIMMLSVMRHTEHSVKFWFIEQFLSPSFKDFIPYLAEEYGFQYEMISYKWPHWLRQQKEKQREIWGYKILFLDVLFPLSLDKVIFVDADQIVRTDMMDLVNLDLQGAPYGFTPMCDSRVEMEGFRFWKQGYWANYLRGLPYHISALYVVDLRRFRELAAGDRLRQQYHSLSADPNSLANLDQDLPNHMQFQIPIHSLPQEWLWCETWCNDESLAQARTIDLCNNPQTKEPKLDRARRQVPEWTLYDDEIAALDRRRKGGKAAASVKETITLTQASGKSGKDRKPDINTKSRKHEEGHKKDEL